MIDVTTMLGGGDEWSAGAAAAVASRNPGRIAVLPTAAAYSGGVSVAEPIAAAMEAEGVAATVVPVLSRRDAESEAFARQVAESSGVVLVGGSPLHLRATLHESACFKAIRHLWRNGGLVAGSGEAASALAEVMVDPRGGAFGVGLGLFGGVTLLARHGSWSSDTLHRTLGMAPPGLPVIGLGASDVAMFADRAWDLGRAPRTSLYRDGCSINVDQLPIDIDSPR